MLCWNYSLLVVVVFCALYCGCEERSKRDDGDSDSRGADGGHFMSHSDSSYHQSALQDHEFHPQYPSQVPARYPQANWGGGSSSDDDDLYGHGPGAGSDFDSRESHEDGDVDYVYYHPPSRPRCPYVADVVIMMDGSDSLTQANFNFGKRVIDEIISQLYLNQVDGYVVGALFFSDSIQEVRLRPFKDNVYLRSLVMNAYQEMGGTGTDYVLYNMRRLFFAEGRYGVPKIGVLMTDGRSRNPATAIEQARMAKSEGIHLITVAVGVVTNPLELRAIASTQGSVVLNPTTNAVLRLVQGFSSLRCPGPGPIPIPYPTVPPVRPGVPGPFPGGPSTYPPVFPGRPSTYPPVFPGGPTTYPPVFPGGPSTYPPVFPGGPSTYRPQPPFPTGTPYPPTRTPYWTPPTPTPPKGPCDDCKFLNGIGYNPHESVCSYYYQCFNQNGVLVPYRRECAFGLFWDQRDLTCKPAAAVNCATDPCKRSPRAYGALGNCRAYWQCSWGRTISAQCCSFSYRFESRRGCVFDAACTVPCPPYQPPPRPEVCNKRPFPQDETQYYEDIGGGREILRRCALGTAFVPAPVCRCDRRIDPGLRPWECKADLYLPFDTDLKDKSGQQLDVYVERVSLDRSPDNGAIGGGAARFNGTGRILVLKYANDDFGSQFVIRLRYKALAALNVSGNEGIVTNSDCVGPCSIAISYDRSSNTTKAKLRTVDGSIAEGLLAHNDGWNTVEYKYDGSRLSFNVNGNVQSISATGNIARVPTALQIGTGCMGYDPFTGLIDELYVYKCLP